MAMTSDDSQVESVVSKCGGLTPYFVLRREDTEPQMIEKLQRLRRENYPTEIDFLPWDIQWTERIALEVIRAFQRYADLNLQWKEGDFRGFDQESEPFGRVVETAAKLKLFRKLTFASSLRGPSIARASPTSLIFTPTPIEEMSIRFAAVLANVLREGRHLEGVTIRHFVFSANAMAAVATGLATAGQAVGLKKLCFSHIRLVGRADSGGIMGAPEYLAAGLASNTTLKELCIEEAYLDDASLGTIVQALSSHPSLEVLRLSDCEYGRNTMRSIHQWLRSDRCRLKELRMDDHYNPSDQSESWDLSQSSDQSQNLDQLEDDLNVVQLFLEDLPQTTSLERLTITGEYIIDIEENDINRLLGSLWKLPNLRTLDISGFFGNVSDFVALSANLVNNTMPAHRLRILNLDGNNVWEGADEEAILEFLENVFPELGYLGETFEELVIDGTLPSSVGLRLHRNRCFGPLRRGAMIPLSLWPLVMAKANVDPFFLPSDEMFESQRATILYEMLQGPAFVGRGSL